MHKVSLCILPEIELEFEPWRAHLSSIEGQAAGDEMLYQDKTLGQAWIGARLVARLAIVLGRRRYADLDLLAMNPHLRRDIGADNLRDAGCGTGDIWRK
jgi:hypothetical protein